MKGVFLLLGTNLGDRLLNLLNAQRKISTNLGQIIDSSKIYETEAWGKNDQPAFLNQVIIIDTQISPENLISKIQQIEQELGN